MIRIVTYIIVVNIMACSVNTLVKSYHTAVVGAGHLGRSLLLRYKRHDPQLRCMAVVRNAATKLKVRDVITTEFGTPFRANQIILCVKPSQAEHVCKVISKSLRPNTVVISAMAAITQQQLETWLDTTNVIRIMPSILDNGPISVYNPHDVCLTLPTTNIIHAETELELDAATAVSGCLPGFLAVTFREMIHAARSVPGSNERMINYLVLRNIRAFAEADIWDISGLENLRSTVATKGGATERGIEKLEDKDALKHLFRSMFQAADGRIAALQGRDISTKHRKHDE